MYWSRIFENIACHKNIDGLTSAYLKFFKEKNTYIKTKKTQKRKTFCYENSHRQGAHCICFKKIRNFP